MTLRARAPRQTDGFTLIEIAVVIAIIGISATVVVPAFSMPFQSENAPWQETRALLLEAQREALATGRTVRAVIAAESGRYRIERIDVRGHANVTEGALSLDGLITRSPTDRYTFVFTPTGMGSSDTLHFVAANRRTSLAVDALTQEIKILQDEGQ